MLSARYLEPWEVLEVDLQRIPNTPEAGNECLLLVVDKASRFLIAYPLPSKEAHAVARLLLDLCLTSPRSSAPTGGASYSHSNGAPLPSAKGADRFRPYRSPEGSG